MRLTTMLFLIFALGSLAEIVTFIWVGERIGVAATIALVVLTAVLGSMMVSRQGRAQLASLRTTVSRGGFPSAEIVNGAMILVAAALLITPGFLTDIVGFLLLTPPVRTALRQWWQRRRRNRVEIL